MKRAERERACAVARDELLRIYLLAEDAGDVGALPLGVTDCCERWKAENGGVLPRRIGGAPRDEHWRLSLSTAVRWELEFGGAGSIAAALQAVSLRAPLTYNRVRNIWYDKKPGWQKTASAEWARLMLENQGNVPGPIDVRAVASNGLQQPRRRRGHK